MTNKVVLRKLQLFGHTENERPVQTVASDLEMITRVGAEIGFSLDVSKCELIAQNDFLANDALLKLFFNRIKTEEAGRHITGNVTLSSHFAYCRGSQDRCCCNRRNKTGLL